MQLASEQIEFFNKNGYLVVEKFLSEERCEHLNRKASEVAGGHFANMLNLHRKSADFHNLLTDPGILALSDSLQQARMIPIGSIYFFCKPGNPLEQGSNMHQDNYAVKAPYAAYFVCGVSFDDADAENGSLIVYPGSHQCGDLPNVPSKNFEYDSSGNISKSYPIGNQVQIPQGHDALQLQHSRGSLIFLHSHTIHGAPKNSSPDRWRRTIYMHYIKDGEPFWPGWNARRQIIDRDATFEQAQAVSRM
jgi:ectoine hydroxylase-related dioxygenase (phytanoyl-CoA dioxygenase family)